MGGPRHVDRTLIKAQVDGESHTGEAMEAAMACRLTRPRTGRTQGSPPARPERSLNGMLTAQL